MENTLESRKEAHYVCKAYKCISCDTAIHIKGETFEEKINRGVYKEITLELSDGSKMRVGVCNVCKEKEKELDCDEILKAVQEYWKNTIKSSRKHIYDNFGAKLKVSQNG